jgi:hypothetical protein
MGCVVSLAQAQTGGPSSIWMPFISGGLKGKLCPANIHDRYQVTGPDGALYATWHPQIDPETGCYFAHEHGDDPRTSKADNSLPAFGYIGKQAAMDEPHPGFKVFVVNAGTVNDEDRVAKAHTRIVAHMGTSGPKRFTERMHSLEFDLVATESNHFVHVQGMADTGLAGDICQRDATTNDSDPNNDIGRTFFVLPDQTSCNVNSSYEIWAFAFNAGGRALVHASTAAFDTATMMDPRDLSKAIPTGDTGCRREAYHGPVYWYHKTGATVFYTDAMGKPGGNIRQEVSNHQTIGIMMNQDQKLMKLVDDSCSKGLTMPN